MNATKFFKKPVALQTLPPEIGGTLCLSDKNDVYKWLFQQQLGLLGVRFSFGRGKELSEQKTPAAFHETAGAERTSYGGSPWICVQIFSTAVSMRLSVSSRLFSVSICTCS